MSDVETAGGVGTEPATAPPTTGQAPPAPATDESAAPAVNVTRLLNEAAAKSKVMWIEIPGAGTHPVWYVWHDDADPRGTGPSAYVVSGPGEQTLPWLPETVQLIFRSKDTGGRLIATHATTREMQQGTPEWDAAVGVLSGERLNATSDAATAWAQGCTLHVITPHGRPTESPGDYSADSGAERIVSSAGTTVGWRPWHLRGRPTVRRRLR